MRIVRYLSSFQRQVFLFPKTANEKKHLFKWRSSYRKRILTEYKSQSGNKREEGHGVSGYLQSVRKLVVEVCVTLNVLEV